MAQGGDPTIVDVRHVFKRFGDTAVLNDISLAVRRGEFVSLLGPSGCGKTTLLRIIAGFEHPNEGQVLLDGTDVAGLPAYARNTNMIFQQLALFPHMSVAQNIAFGLRMKKLPKDTIAAKVAEALQIIQLKGFEHRKPDELSGGQRQRVALARALVNSPDVLLLDEPLGALDLQLRQQLQLELRRLQRSLGKTFIFVTHDQTEAITMSDRIAVMNKGRIEQFGSPRDIYEKPRTRFVAGFVGHSNLLHGVVERAVSPDLCLVALESGGALVGASNPGGAGPGTPVLVSVRFESTQVNGASAAIDGVVREKIYMGGFIRVMAATPGGATLTADMPLTESAGALAEGDAVSLSWSPESAMALME